MKDKVALVTGGSRGIGRACAFKLAEDGYYVIINYAHNRSDAEFTLEEIRNNGGEGHLCQASINSPTDVQYMFEEIANIDKRLDVLVNNAGCIKDVSLFNMNIKMDFDKSFNTNIKGPLACISEAAKIMFTQKSGSIINISSISSIRGNPGQSIYSATKGAINSMTITAAKELAPFGIRVNAVLPGFVETDMVNSIPKDKLNRALNRIPMQRIGLPEDIANAVAFLASNNSSYITGNLMVVDGGLSL